MKVVYVYRDSYPPLHGGIEQYTHTLVHQLKREISPAVLVSGTKPSVMDDHGVPITSVGSYGRPQGAPISPGLPAALKKSGADLFHFHTPNPTGELAYLLAGESTPAVTTYHTDVIRQALAFKVWKPFLLEFLKRMKRIIVASPYHIDCSTILPAYRDKCRLIPYGIDVERYAATPAVTRQAELIREKHGEKIVLFVGKLRHYKGLDYLLQAMPKIDARLLIVGKGAEEERLKGVADSLNLGDKVVWLPHMENEEFLGMYHACDVFAFPSCNRMEMFGLVQLEAHACGKPVVSTALGTGVEFVNQHEKTGLVVPPCDVPSLASAINRLLADEGLRRQMGETARQRVLAEFTQERMAQQTLEVYREVLG